MKTGFSLASRSWAVLRGHRSLTLFPLGGAVLVIVLVGPAAVGGAVLLDQQDTVPGAILVALAAYGAAFITTFFAVGLAVTADRALRGEQASFGDGLRAASGRLPQVAGWALLNAVLSIALRALESRGTLGQVAAAIVGGAWSVVSLLAVPVIAFEGSGAVASLRRSAELFKKHWGNQLTGVATVSLAAVLLGVLPGIALIALGVAILSGSGTAAGAAVLIGAGLVVLTVALLVASALRQVFAVALYHYASSGEAVGGFEPEELDHAVRTGNRRIAIA
jgi:Family of unknown function (DUF6159)